MARHPPWTTPHIYGIRKAQIEREEADAEAREKYNREHPAPPAPPRPPPPPKPEPPPSTFFVKVSPSRGYARLHRGECWLCKDGQGKAGKLPAPLGGDYWTKGFAKLDDATALVASLGYVDVADCPHCKPR